MNRDRRRRFSRREKAALYLATGGRCAQCDTELAPDWHADHVHPHAAGGATDVVNGAPLCPHCNVRKGAAVPQPSLREWQQAALDKLDSTSQENFLVTATPGAGKTTFALEAARRMHRQVRSLLVVVPSSNLRRQWASAASKFGIELDCEFTPDKGSLARDYDGTVITYQAVQENPHIYRRIAHRAFVILDEVHHAGESKSWGDALRTACEPATRRLLLSGTPFRSDNNAIPFVTYAPNEDGVWRSKADYTYGYGDGVKDNVVRPIAFPALDGEGEWSDTGTVVKGNLSNEDEAQAKKALRTVLDSRGKWIQSVLRSANEELTRNRQHTPDAAGLVVCNDQTQAREYARILNGITGEEPALAVSDEPDASQVIREFTTAHSRWIVAVQMVSEGVDIPRLTVGVYASRIMTALFFRQVAGRFVRTRNDDDETCATLYIPAVATLLKHAAEMETELEHALTEALEKDDEDDGMSPDPNSGTLFSFIETITSSEATHDRTILSGEEYTEAEIDQARRLIDQSGMHKFSPAEVAQLVRLVPTAEQPDPDKTADPAASEHSLADRKKTLRKKINSRVNLLARRSGQEYKHIHAELNRMTSENSINQATEDTLKQRLTSLQKKLEELR